MPEGSRYPVENVGTLWLEFGILWRGFQRVPGVPSVTLTLDSFLNLDLNLDSFLSTKNNCPSGMFPFSSGAQRVPSPEGFQEPSGPGGSWHPLAKGVPGTLCGDHRIPWNPGTPSDPPLSCGAKKS